jgi:hypothetical protein
MQITFQSSDGQLITIADPRREPGKDVTNALHGDRPPTAWIVSSLEVRRPAGWVISSMKV